MQKIKNIFSKLQKKYLHSISIFFALLIIYFAPQFCCVSSVYAAHSSPTVLVTIKPLYCLVQEIMKGVGSVQLLIPPFESPHTYQFSIKDRQRIEKTDLLVAVGSGLEPFLDKLLPLFSRKKLFLATNVKEIYQLKQRFIHDSCGHNSESQTLEGSDDPHIWLDPKNALAFAKAYCDYLKTQDPVHAQQYQKNYQVVAQKLIELTQRIQSVFQDKPVHYIAFHDAYAYFDHAFGTVCIDVITAVPEHPEVTIQTLQNLLKNPHLKVFIEPQFDEKILKKIAKISSNSILDPYGIDTGEGIEGYTKMIENIATCLQA